MYKIFKQNIKMKIKFISSKEMTESKWSLKKRTKQTENYHPPPRLLLKLLEKDAQSWKQWPALVDGKELTHVKKG